MVTELTSEESESELTDGWAVELTHGWTVEASFVVLINHLKNYNIIDITMYNYYNIVYTCPYSSNHETQHLN